MDKAIKIIVISDTHRNISNAIDIINAENPAYVLHLGDLSEDAELLEEIYPKIIFSSVSGNCDWPRASKSPCEKMFSLSGVNILMCHGHSYGVKSGVEEYLSSARARGAAIALFGHTHRPLCDHRGDVLLLNPGSVDTYGWIEIADGTFKAGIKRFEEIV